MKRFSVLIVVFLLILSFSSSVFASSADDIPVSSTASATSFVLMDADTGDVLAGRNSDLPLPMASTTKIMTCIVALEEKDIAEQVKISKEAVGVEGSSVYLSKGEELTLEELLYALMLESANDAAVAIACHVSGSPQAFAEKMNEKAAEIGMTTTKFQNPHGLPADMHYSTARDLSKLMQYSLQNETFCQIVSSKTRKISAPEGKTRFLSNHNKLLRLYADCIGGKTGFTKAAGRCLVSAAKRDGKTLICATLGDPDDWRDHMSLFDYGFSQYTNRVISDVGTYRFSVPVIGAKCAEINVYNSESFALPLRSNEQIAYKVELPCFVYGGIKEGDIIGSVVFYRGDTEIRRLPLVSEDTAMLREEKMSFWARIWQNIILWMN